MGGLQFAVSQFKASERGTSCALDLNCIKFPGRVCILNIPPWCFANECNVSNVSRAQDMFTDVTAWTSRFKMLSARTHLVASYQDKAGRY
jgi:hypothetical protein